MTPETQKRYKQTAEHFYRTRLTDQPLATSAILKALTIAAPDYRPNSFRKLKNAIAFDVRARGYPAAADKILRLENPVTAPGSSMTVKQKLQIVKTVSEEDFTTLLRHLQANRCSEEFSALVLAWFLGVRPCEMRGITVDEGRFQITGAKQSHEGQRGANRVLEIHNADIRNAVESAILILQQSPRSIGAIRDRFRHQCRQLWPRRKRHPTLKSLRHQFSSNLKASGAQAKVIAYLMGHQSTRSVERYGDPRQGRTGGLSLQAEPAEADLQHVRTPSRPPAPWKGLKQPAPPQSYSARGKGQSRSRQG